MSNYFDLVIETPQANLSAGMHWFCWAVNGPDRKRLAYPGTCGRQFALEAIGR